MRISDWSSDVCSSDLAAEPGDGAARAFPALETLGYLAEHDVPPLVPEGVVDRLEAIDVDQQQRGGRIGGAAIAEQRRRAFDKAAPVMQVRQRIAPGKLACPRLGGARVVAFHPKAREPPRRRDRQPQGLKRG